MPVFGYRSFSSAIDRHKLLENVFWLSSAASGQNHEQSGLGSRWQQQQAGGQGRITHLEDETANSRRRRRCYGCAC